MKTLISIALLVFPAFASANDFTGEEIFTGVVLHYGNVAEAIPEIRDRYHLDEETLSKAGGHDKIQKGIKLLVDRVKILNPSFFNSFQNEMTSGNPLRVEAALVKARELARNAVSTFNINLNGHGRRDVERPMNDTCVVVILHNVAYLTAVYQVVIAVANYIAVGGGGGGGSSTWDPSVIHSAGDTLSETMLVGSIAETLAR